MPQPQSFKSSTTTGAGGELSMGSAGPPRIGRAYAIQGDTTKARTAYQDFLTLWRDADLDVPILKQAKREYAKVRD